MTVTFAGIQAEAVRSAPPRDSWALVPELLHGRMGTPTVEFKLMNSYFLTERCYTMAMLYYSYIQACSFYVLLQYYITSTQI